jgi:hypothetical protein
MSDYTLHAVAFRRGDWWIAQCLEHRLSTQTRTLEELPYELNRLLTVQIQVSLARGIEPFAGFSPAPKRFWKMYERARVRVEPVSPSGETVLQTETRLAA